MLDFVLAEASSQKMPFSWTELFSFVGYFDVNSFDSVGFVGVEELGSVELSFVVVVVATLLGCQYDYVMEMKADSCVVMLNWEEMEPKSD